MAWLPDGRPLITRKDGTLHILNGKRFDKVPLEGLPPVYTSGQDGLLDIALHPGDKVNPPVYLMMSTGTGAANRTILVREIISSLGYT